MTRKTLIARINRRLRLDGQQLRTARGNDPQLGRYYTVDVHTGAVTAQHVDPEQWGREMGIPV